MNKKMVVALGAFLFQEMCERCGTFSSSDQKTVRTRSHGKALLEVSVYPLGSRLFYDMHSSVLQSI